MAKGKKTGGKDIKPGEVRNPYGRPKLPEYLKQANKMNKIKFNEILNKYIHCTAKELHSFLNDAKTTSLELVVIKILVEAIKKGDEKKLTFILDRLIGKVPNELDLGMGGEDLSLKVEFVKPSEN